MTCRKIGKELYVVLLADGIDFVYLFLMLIQLIFRQGSINNIYLSYSALDLLCFDNEGWTILLIVVCHMFFKVRGYKNGCFYSCGYKNIQLICPISFKVLTKIRKEITDTLSKLLPCVLLYFGRSSSWRVF